MECTTVVYRSLCLYMYIFAILLLLPDSYGGRLFVSVHSVYVHISSVDEEATEVLYQFRLFQSIYNIQSFMLIIADHHTVRLLLDQIVFLYSLDCKEGPMKKNSLCVCVCAVCIGVKKTFFSKNRFSCSGCQKKCFQSE